MSLKLKKYITLRRCISPFAVFYCGLLILVVQYQKSADDDSAKKYSMGQLEDTIQNLAQQTGNLNNNISSVSELLLQMAQANAADKAMAERREKELEVKQAQLQKELNEAREMIRKNTQRGLKSAEKKSAGPPTPAPTKSSIKPMHPPPRIRAFEPKRQWDDIVTVEANGKLVINKTNLMREARRSWKKWNHEMEVMAFMHIGKNGGTSFRSSLLAATHDKGCKLKSAGSAASQRITKCPGSVTCVCNRHYDWTVIDNMERKGVQVAPVVLLRDPVKRAMSHFYFSKTLSWTKGLVLRQETISNYLNDTVSMLETRDVWQDGQAAVSWFSMTHIGNWVVKLNEQQKQARETLGLDWHYLLNSALHNYHKSLWVGIIEKMDESLKLLKHQAGLTAKMGHSNKNSKKGQAPSDKDVTVLRKLMPLDSWFYTYASLFHDIKMKLYDMEVLALAKLNDPLYGGSKPNGTLNKPDGPDGKLYNPALQDQVLEPLIDDMISKLPKQLIGCKSSRFILSCPDDGFFFHWTMDDNLRNQQQMALFTGS